MSAISRLLDFILSEKPKERRDATANGVALPARNRTTSAFQRLGSAGVRSS